MLLHFAELSQLTLQNNIVCTHNLALYTNSGQSPPPCGDQGIIQDFSLEGERVGRGEQ